MTRDKLTHFHTALQDEVNQGWRGPYLRAKLVPKHFAELYRGATVHYPAFMFINHHRHHHH